MIKKHPGLFVGIGGFILGFILYAVNITFIHSFWLGAFMLLYWLEWIYWLTYFHGKWVNGKMKK